MSDNHERETFCQALGLTPAELAEHLGVSLGAVNSWERGKASPRGAPGRRVAELMAEVVDDLATRDGACRIERCIRRIRSGGLCSLHQRRRTLGDPMVQPHDLIGEVASGFGLLGIVERDEYAVMCHECGGWFGALTQHLRQIHEITVEEHRDTHQLPSQTPLVALSVSETISEQSTRRIGTPGWHSFTARRDETLPESQKMASEASQHARLGTRATRAQQASARFADNRAAHRDEERWQARLDALLAWWKQTGRPPARASEDKEERSLAQWLQHQRAAHRDGKLTHERRAAMEAAGIELSPGKGSRWWR